uniref:Uncharacterized protein n=1 Tax=Arion vulgaris TaxID=1028688 RepID=A0A0B6XUK6_9EUPU
MELSFLGTRIIEQKRRSVGRKFNFLQQKCLNNINIMEMKDDDDGYNSSDDDLL